MFDGQLEEEHKRYKAALEAIAKDQDYYRRGGVRCKSAKEIARVALICRCGMCRDCYKLEEWAHEGREIMREHRIAKDGA